MPATEVAWEKKFAAEGENLRLSEGRNDYQHCFEVAALLVKVATLVVEVATLLVEVAALVSEVTTLLAEVASLQAGLAISHWTVCASHRS